MNTRLPRCLAAAGLALLVAAGSAHAAAGNADTPDRGEERTQERASPQGKSASPSPKKEPSRFQSCRRDAKGKSGPDRASFMTECLHERH